MAGFGVGEGLLNADEPVRVLVLGDSEDGALIHDAVRAVTGGSEIDTCETLRDAEDRIRARGYDVTVLAPPLPDAWIADAYSKLRENDRSSESLILLAAADDASSIKRTEHPPFAILVKSHITPELLSRLLLSAALYKRACDDAPDAIVRLEGLRA